MALKRRIRRTGHSLTVALPSQLAELKAGDVVVFDYLGRGSLKISKED